MRKYYKIIRSEVVMPALTVRDGAGTMMSYVVDQVLRLRRGRARRRVLTVEVVR